MKTLILAFSLLFSASVYSQVWNIKPGTYTSETDPGCGLELKSLPSMNKIIVTYTLIPQYSLKCNKENLSIEFVCKSKQCVRFEDEEVLLYASGKENFTIESTSPYAPSLEIFTFNH